MKLRVRIDDVMCQSSAFNEEKSIRQINKIFRWLTQEKKIHFTPTILITEIQEWPSAINLLIKATEEGLCEPQIHGYKHIDYGKLTFTEICEHLEKSLEWFKQNLNYEPLIWCTPWGGISENIVNAAKKYRLQVETTHGTITPGKAIGIASSSSDLSVLSGMTVMEHWWKRGLNLLRLVEILKAGSYNEAIKNREDLFDGA